MATTTISIPSTASPTDLREQLRDQEDLFFRLTAFVADQEGGQTIFTFRLERQLPVPAEDELLDLALFPEAKAPAEQEGAKASFISFGGAVLAEGFIAVGQRSVYAIAYRGAGPEWPKAHEDTLPPIAAIEAPLPDHAQQFLGSERTTVNGVSWGGLPWGAATPEEQHMSGLLNPQVQTFRNRAGRAIAVILQTDADIDTDGDNGNPADDPNHLPHTALPGCDSFKFPGVVRNNILLNQYGVQKGDYAYICYGGRIQACQVYDHHPTEIGEISIFAARRVKTIPDTMSDRDAARRGDLTDTSNPEKQLITLFFPGSGPGKAKSVPEIEREARRIFEDFTGRSVEVSPADVTATKPATLSGAGSAGAPKIFDRAAWGARKPKVSSFAPSAAEGIVVHNTENENRAPLAAAAELAKAFEISRSIQSSHMNTNKWSDIGQHFTISRGGVIMEARFGTLDAAKNGDVVRGAHAGSNKHNARWWGIELEGDYRKSLEITKEQRSALADLCAWLCSVGKFKSDRDHIKGHKEVKTADGGTDCPGKMLGELDRLCEEVTKRLSNGGA